MHRRCTKKVERKNARLHRPQVAACGFLIIMIAWYLVMVTSSVGARYTLRDIGDTYTALNNEREGLEDQLSQDLSPGVLEQKTKALGLVRVAGAEYITISVGDSVAEAAPKERQF